MNDIMYLIIAVLFLIIGITLGISYTSDKIRKTKAGYLNIDHSIPGEINFFADLDMPVEQIQNRMYIVFEVKNVNYIEESKKNAKHKK